jgi:hypothetical protein
MEKGGGLFAGRERKHPLDARGGAATEVFLERDNLIGPRGAEGVADFFEGI